jgi:hypothetical protein
MLTGSTGEKEYYGTKGRSQMNKRDTRTLLLAMLVEEGIEEPQMWAVETILEFEDVSPFRMEYFDYEAHKKMFLFMYNTCLDLHPGRKDA